MTGTERARHGGLRRALLIGLPSLLLLAFAMTLQSPATAEDTSSVLIQFNHRKHVDAGAQCLYCHPGGLTGKVSGIPSTQKCMGCHRNIEIRGEEGQADVDKLLRAWETGQPLLWPKVVDLPDFAYFSHFPHINAGKNCERCHGDVSSMAVVVPAYRINMGFCLKNCHRHQEPEKRERLMNCVTCHQ